MSKEPSYELWVPAPKVPFSEGERLRIVSDFPEVVGHGPYDELNSPFGHVYRAGYQKIFLKKPDDIAVITFHDKDLKFHASGGNYIYPRGFKHWVFDSLYDAVKWFVETPKEERRYG